MKYFENPLFLYFSLSDCIQILLGLIGFFIIFIQLLKTKSASNAAKRATDETYKKIIDRLNTESIQKINFGLNDLFNSIRMGSYEWALFRVQDLREEIIRYKDRERNFSIQTNRNIEIAIRDLSKINLSLSISLSDHKKPKVSDMLPVIETILSSTHDWDRSQNEQENP